MYDERESIFFGLYNITVKISIIVSIYGLPSPFFNLLNQISTPSMDWAHQNKYFLNTLWSETLGHLKHQPFGDKSVGPS